MEQSIRVAQAQAAMQRDGLEAVVVRLPENILLLTGWFVRYPGAAFAIIPPEGNAVLVLPDYETAEADDLPGVSVRACSLGEDYPEPVETVAVRILRDIAGSIGAKGGAVGIEASFETVAPPSFWGEPGAVGRPTHELIASAFSTDSLIDFTNQLEEIRAVKTEREVALIRRTNEIAVFGLDAFKRAAVPGATEVEVMAEVERAITVAGHGYDGARWVRGFATVCSGPRTIVGWQFFRASTRTIEPNDAVMIELGTVADGYWSDHTRTVVAGTAPASLRDAHAAVQSALRAAFATARPGATGHDVDAAARRACSEHGFTQFLHHTGHGTGFRYHESRPALIPGSDSRLLEGQVIAVEPGIYGPELGAGVRHEDDAVITANGAMILATTDYDLDL